MQVEMTASDNDRSRLASFGAPRFLKGVCCAVLFALPVIGASAAAADEVGTTGSPAFSVDELALELSNPVTALRTFAVDVQYRTYQGDFPGSSDQAAMRTVFTPSWPIRLRSGTKLLLSATIPVNSDQPTWAVNAQCQCVAEFLMRQSPVISPTSGQFEYGHDYTDDIGFDLAYGGVNENGSISMLGFASVFPTSSDDSADRDSWLIGPDIVLGRVARWGLFGVRARHLTNIGGPTTWEFDEGRGTSWDTNETTLQLFFAYSLGKGWQVESTPVILYDWEAISGNEWSVPIGAGISRTFLLAGIPMKLGLEIQKYVVSPDRFGPDWQFKLNFTPVISTRLLR
jgi:hypothetical protein